MVSNIFTYLMRHKNDINSKSATERERNYIILYWEHSSCLYAEPFSVCLSQNAFWHRNSLKNAFCNLFSCERETALKDRSGAGSGWWCCWALRWREGEKSSHRAAVTWRRQGVTGRAVRLQGAPVGIFLFLTQGNTQMLTNILITQIRCQDQLLKVSTVNVSLH